MAERPLIGQDMEALEEPAEVTPLDGADAVEDVDIEAWLNSQAAAGGARGQVVIDGKRIPIAVVTEGEENRLIRQARRPDPRNPREFRTDMLYYRRAYVAFSITKATGNQILAEDPRLLAMPPGVITRLMTEINRLSGHEIASQRQDPFEFLT